MQFYLAINGKPWSKDNPEPWVTENPMSLMTRENVVGQIYDSAWVHAPRHVLFIDTDAGTVKDVVHEIAILLIGLTVWESHTKEKKRENERYDNRIGYCAFKGAGSDR
jgi:hypothetical protein